MYYHTSDSGAKVVNVDHNDDDNMGYVRQLETEMDIQKPTIIVT